MTAILKLALGGLAYFLLAKISMLFFAAQPDNIALLWLPAGLGLYLYSRQGKPALAAIFAASFLANYSGLANETIWQQALHTAIAAAADSLFAYLSGTLLTARLSAGVNKPLDIFDFLLYCCLIPITVSTVIIGGNLWWGGYLSEEQAVVTSLSVFISDFLGTLLIFPLFPAWERRAAEPGGITGTWLVATLTSLGLIASSFYFAPWLLYFVLPALVYIVIGVKSLYAYGALSSVVLLYNLLSVHFLEGSAITEERLGVLILSCSVTIAMLAMAIQQRSLIAEQSLRQQWMISATHDTLTELPNRANISFLIRHQIARLKRTPGTFTLAMVDIDHFKSINDSYGHGAGDKVLVELARRLKSAFRASDVISRYGGEEFLILLLDTHLHDAQRLINHVREQVASKPFDIGEKSVNITFSAGLAEYEPAEDDGFAHLINLADQRLYEAKGEGRNRVVC